MLGTAIAAAGMGLLSLMSLHSTRLDNGIYMAVLGVGIGLVLQILVLVVQNDAEPRGPGHGDRRDQLLPPARRLAWAAGSSARCSPAGCRAS